jgi:hypothetical protein
VFAGTNKEDDMFVEVEEEEGEVAGANKEDVEGDEEDEEIRCMKDCCELANFNVEQKQLLQEMQDSLEAKESEATQLRKMIALSISFIIQSLKGFDRFYSPMVHFAVVMGIDEDGNRLYRGDEYSFKLAGFIYCIRVLFVEHTLPAENRAERTERDIDRFLEMDGLRQDDEYAKDQPTQYHLVSIYRESTR